MKKNQILSIIMSIILLGGVLLSPASHANAAEGRTSTFSDQNDMTTEDQTSEEFADENDYSEEELALMKEQVELGKYFDQIDALLPYEAKAMDTLSSVGYKVTSANRKSMYLKLTNTVIPNYTKMVSMAKLINSSNPEIKKIHANFVKGAYLQLEGCMLYQQAVSKNKINDKLLQQGNAKVKAARVYLDQYDQMMRAYAKKIGYE